MDIPGSAGSAAAADCGRARPNTSGGASVCRRDAICRNDRLPHAHAVDRWSGGDPDRAGRAYAVNVVGCIVGPLICGFLLLPLVGERWSVLLLALPWLPWHLPGAGRACRNSAGWQLTPFSYWRLGVLLASRDFELSFRFEEFCAILPQPSLRREKAWTGACW